LRVPAVILVVFCLILIVVLLHPRLDDLPGVWPRGTRQREEFAVQFWAALYSGIIVSLIVGLLVGGAILLVEQRADERHLRQDYRREAARFQERLYRLLRRRERERWDTAVGSLPQNVEEVLDLVEIQPLAAWREYLPSLSPLFEALDRYQWDYERFIHFASSLDDWLPTAVADELVGAGASVVQAGPCASYFLVRATGQTVHEAAAELNIGAPAVQALCEQVYSTLHEGHGSRLAGQYARYRNQLDVDRWKLVEICGQIPGEEVR
jgi:hypothetical protein